MNAANRRGKPGARPGLPLFRALPSAATMLMRRLVSDLEICVRKNSGGTGFPQAQILTDKPAYQLTDSTFGGTAFLWGS